MVKTYKGMPYEELYGGRLDPDAIEQLAVDLGFDGDYGACSLCPVVLNGDLDEIGMCPHSRRICDTDMVHSHTIHADYIPILQLRGAIGNED